MTDGVIADPNTHSLAPVKKRKGFLSKAFSLALAAGAGAAASFAIKTCAFSVLCTAGAPAAVTTAAALAATGLLVGTGKAYLQYRAEKKENENAQFFTAARARSIGLHTAMSLCGGAAFMMFGDTITDTLANVFETAGEKFDSLFIAHAAEPAIDTTTPAAADPVLPPAPAPVIDIEAPVAPLAPAPVVETLDMPAAMEEAALPAQPEPPAAVAVEPAPDMQAAMEPVELPEPQRMIAFPEVETAEIQAPAVSWGEALPEIDLLAGDLFYMDHVHTVVRGDTLWEIVEEHYGLTTNADIQKYADAVAAANDMTGLMANNIDIGDKITLPDSRMIFDTGLTQDWVALDEDTAQKLTQLQGTKEITSTFALNSVPAGNGFNCIPVSGGTDIGYQCITGSNIPLAAGDRVVINNAALKI